MSRTWPQWIVGWLPIGALFAVLIVSAHGGAFGDAALTALRMMIVAAFLGVFVYRFTAHQPWPYPLQARFFVIHLLAALVYSLAWFALNMFLGSLMESARLSFSEGRGVLVLAIGPGVTPYLILGVWLYVMVAGVAYANRAAERSAQIEALAARTQLAELRAQLHPHLLFNALHTVVQLIPVDPGRATRAAEELAGILRMALSDQRDVVPLAQEWAFVQRYLAIESLRFGERLNASADIDASALAALTPAFALQTLVENAVRHAAAPRVESTELNITARCDSDVLTLTVADNGPGAALSELEQTRGTGLKRLRERLIRLCGDGAKLDIDGAPGGRGLRATLKLPQRPLRAFASANEADDG